MAKVTIVHPNNRVFVAEADLDGHAYFLGCCALCFDGTDVDVTTLGVNEEFRRIGVGRAMMERLLGEARALGEPKVRLNLQLDNSGAKGVGVAELSVDTHAVGELPTTHGGPPPN